MIDDSDIRDRLAELDATFKEAPTDDSMPEAGTYQGIIRSFDNFEGKSDGTRYLKAVIEVVLDSKYEGWEVDKVWTWIPGPGMDASRARKSLGFFKKDLMTLGVPCEDEDFSFTSVYPGSQVLEDLLDVPIEFAIVEGGDKPAEKGGGKYKNVYINARTGDPLPTAGGKPVPASDVPSDVPPAKDGSEFGDDVPFDGEDSTAPKAEDF